MPNLIESSEFGDWLVAEISKTRGQSRAANFERALAARQRQEDLKVAKQVLCEFLTIQQAMFEAATAARRALAIPCHGVQHSIPKVITRPCLECL